MTASTPAPSAMNRDELMHFMLKRNLLSDLSYRALMNGDSATLNLDWLKRFADEVLASQPVAAAPVHQPFTEAQAVEAWACVRKNNHSIPDDALDGMLATLRAALQQRQAPSPIPCPACDGKGGWKTAEWIDPISGPECEAERCTDCNGTGQAEAAPVAMTNAEAAQWARDNGLNVPANWTEAAPAPTAEPVRLPAIVATWLSSEAERRRAIAAHNAAFSEASKEPWPGRDIDAEYQAMNAAQNAEHRARMAMAAELLASPSPHPVSIGAGPLKDHEMTRLRRLMKALGQADAFERDDDYVRGVLCTVLGIAAGKIERSAHPSPEGGAAEAKLEQLIAEHRIAITPEYEGGFHAHIHRDQDTPQAYGYGPTPRAAVDAALAATPSTQQETDK